MRVVAIVQARMGSRRLPGKVLMPLASQPLLWHVVHRLQKCASLHAIVIATSTLPENDAIARFAESLQVPLYRGAEEDVLARFSACAAAFDAGIIVRANADAPLIDPALTDALVARLIATDADYVMPPPGVPCFHDGVDPMSRRVLDRLMREAHGDPLAREHVTGFLKANRRFARIVFAEVEAALAVVGPRLSVDTAEDLAFFEGLYRRLGAAPGELDLRRVAALYAAEAKALTRTTVR